MCCIPHYGNTLHTVPEILPYFKDLHVDVSLRVNDGRSGRDDVLVLRSGNDEGRAVGGGGRHNSIRYPWSLTNQAKASLKKD